MLQAARGMSKAELAGAFFADGGPRNINNRDRAALVATLISSFTPEDRPLVRHLTSLEIKAVRDADEGCGDTLLACCWLLFMLGEVVDAALVWEAKNVNFDTHCYVDSVFLIPRGVAATADFARSRGLADLAGWVEGAWIGDTEEAARQWRTGSFFAKVPSAAVTTEELVTWMLQ